MSLVAAKKYLRENWPFLALLVLALLLRLPSPEGLSTYQSDELLRDLAAVKGLAAGHWIWLGPPSKFTAFAFGPAYYYLYLPFAWLGGFKIWSLALGSLFFSLSEIALIFFVAKRWFRDVRLAWLIAGLVAVSALDIQFAKYASNPNALPFFCLLFFAALERFIGRRAGLGAALTAGLAYGIAIQLHIVPLVSLTLILLYLAAARLIRPRLKDVLVFAAAVLLLNAPYVYYQVTHGFAALWGIAAARPDGISAIDTWPTRFAEIASFWISLVVRLSQLYGGDVLNGLAALVAGYANVILLTLIWFLERRRNAPAVPTALPPAVKTLLLLWLAVPTAVLAAPFGRVDILPLYYFTMLIPLGYLLLGLGLKKMWSLRLRWTAGGLLFSYILWQIVQIWQYHLAYPSLLTAWLR